MKVYLANRRATILNTIRDWKERYPSVEIEDFQHLAGPPADLAIRSPCSAQDVSEGFLWQDGPELLQNPRSDWPLSQDFCSPSSIPDVERNADFKPNSAKSSLGRPSMICSFQKALATGKSSCSCRPCSLLGKDPVRGILAPVLRTSAVLAKKSNRGGFATYSKTKYSKTLAGVSVPKTMQKLTGSLSC